jgi:uncharacterized protein (TIRG00374 family)
MGNWERLRNRVIIGLLFGALVLVALSLFADARQLPTVLAGFGWQWLPLILGLTLGNYALRFVKWQYYLRVLGINGVSTGASLSIFLSGMTMAMTPGKLGELLKSYMLRQLNGAPLSLTAPMVVAERLTDGLAVLGLAAFGLIVYPYGWQVLIGFLLLTAAIVAVAQSRRLVHWLLGLAERLPVVARIAHHLYALYESTHRLLRWRPLLIAVGLGLISWAGECLAFFFVLVGLGFSPDLTLLLQATFILAMATLVGSVSMLPGGLGAAEASVTSLLLLLVAGMTQAVAVAATLLIRFCTLWFGVLLGMLTLILFGRRLLGQAAPAPADGEAALAAGQRE